MNTTNRMAWGAGLTTEAADGTTLDAWFRWFGWGEFGDDERSSDGGDADPPYALVEGDPLPQRDALYRSANAIAGPRCVSCRRAAERPTRCRVRRRWRVHGLGCLG